MQPIDHELARKLQAAGPQVIADLSATDPALFLGPHRLGLTPRCAALRKRPRSESTDPVALSSNGSSAASTSRPAPQPPPPPPPPRRHACLSATAPPPPRRLRQEPHGRPPQWPSFRSPQPTTQPSWRPRAATSTTQLGRRSAPVVTLRLAPGAHRQHHRHHRHTVPLLHNPTTAARPAAEAAAARPRGPALAAHSRQHSRTGGAARRRPRRSRATAKPQWRRPAPRAHRRQHHRCRTLGLTRDRFGNGRGGGGGASGGMQRPTSWHGCR